jgi:HK97 gp10 family phage protein
MTVVVTGIKELDRKLARLPGKVQRKVLRQAMRAGMKLVLEEAKAEAPVDTGRLRGAIKLRAAKNRTRGSVALEVRIEGADFEENHFYPAQVEYGRAGMSAEPFMGPSFDAMGPTARDVAMVKLRDGVEREASQG